MAWTGQLDANDCRARPWMAAPLAGTDRRAPPAGPRGGAGECERRARRARSEPMSQMLDAVALQPVARVEDVAGVGLDGVVVEAVVVDQQDDRVRAGELLGSEVDEGDTAIDLLLEDVRVGGPDLRAEGER